uniref:Ferritin light chain n=1 Tax=Myotis lucifugus TaxID=59463 RepID=G1QBS1_MYOLU
APKFIHYSTQVEAAVTLLANLPLPAPHLPLSGLLFPPRQCGSGGRGGGRFFLELAEKNEGAECLLKLQNQRGGRIPFQDVLKQNSGQVGKTQDTMEAALALERNPDPGPLGATGPGSTRTDPPPGDFLQNHFRGEEVKLINKMGDIRLTSAGCWPRAGLGESFSKGSPSSTTRSLWSPEAFEGPLCI